MSQIVETSSETSKEQPTLRERKFARTKHALLQAAVERLRNKKLDDITVKELCEEVEVSEATFFNYFPKKDDLLSYLMQLFSVDVAWHARGTAGADAGLQYIEQVFDFTAQQVADHPRLMLEIVSQLARSSPGTNRATPSVPELTLAERLQAFPDTQGAEDVPEQSLSDQLRAALERAVDRDELPQSADLHAGLLALLSIFFGVPLCLASSNPERVSSAYKRQLQLVWSGLRARAS